LNNLQTNETLTDQVKKLYQMIKKQLLLNLQNFKLYTKNNSGKNQDFKNFNSMTETQKFSYIINKQSLYLKELNLHKKLGDF